jgi:hypothetical protein
VFMCFALKMTRGGIATPAALIHSIAVIHSCWPCTTFQLDFSLILTSALDDWLVPTAKPDSSMLYRRSGGYWSCSWSSVAVSNHGFTASAVAALCRGPSIWRVYMPWISGWRVRNRCSHLSPIGRVCNEA